MRTIKALDHNKLISLIAIDECHVCSQWGHSFRPKFRKLGILREIVSHAPCLALTATATARTQRDVVDILRLGERRRVPSIAPGVRLRPPPVAALAKAAAASGLSRVTQVINQATAQGSAATDGRIVAFSRLAMLVGHTYAQQLAVYSPPEHSLQGRAKNNSNAASSKPASRKPAADAPSTSSAGSDLKAMLAARVQAQQRALREKQERERAKAAGLSPTTAEKPSSSSSSSSGLKPTPLASLAGPPATSTATERPAASTTTSQHLRVVTQSFDRPNLHLTVLPKRSGAERGGPVDAGILNQMLAVCGPRYVNQPISTSYLEFY
jgi:hypothetical protein